jgi:hypothetical protein
MGWQPLVEDLHTEEELEPSADEDNGDSEYEQSDAATQTSQPVNRTPLPRSARRQLSFRPLWQSPIPTRVAGFDPRPRQIVPVYRREGLDELSVPNPDSYNGSEMPTLDLDRTSPPEDFYTWSARRRQMVTPYAQLEAIGANVACLRTDPSLWDLLVDYEPNLFLSSQFWGTLPASIVPLRYDNEKLRDIINTLN